MQYDFRDIEQRWQQTWRQQQTFRTPNPGEPGFEADKPKFYVLDMFPYPSGVGLHVGHPLGYIATDIVARYKRMRGFAVLHPMGYDAFGLPAEQFAVEHGVHPAITTQRNIDNMTRQLKQLGLSYDWDRCVSTTDPAYYKWTQWIFLQLYHAWFDPAENRARPISELVTMLESDAAYIGADGELLLSPAEGLDALEGTPIGAMKWYELSAQQQADFLDDRRLAFLSEAPVNWCPALGTVLANEEVTADGRSERGNHPVFKRPLRQWMLRITAYAQRLEADLASVDWPEPIKLMQRNWIGKSMGAMVDFKIDDSDEAIRVFTTRPDTLFGATYMVLAPEHMLVEAITTDAHRKAVETYRAQAGEQSDEARMADGRKKTGVFTGAYAVNPVNGERIPIWIADYVLMGYGTGAIMAVPAHDQRDFEFAMAHEIKMRAVVMPPPNWLGGHDIEIEDYVDDPTLVDEAYGGVDGAAINSENSGVSLNGLPTPDAKQRMIQWLENSVNGQAQVQYKLRDWLFSRQRYWGEPFPILHGPDGQVRAVDEADLPVLLPDMEDFRPQGSDDPDAPPQPPLSRAGDDWKYVEIDGVRYTREFNTMPQWAGSCWYYLRFLDPGNDQAFVGEAAERYWMVSRKKSGDPHAGGVDLYVGGAEHAVLHLLYARFWHKVLFDLGHVSTPEPFGRLFNQGYIQAYAYTDDRGAYRTAREVEEKPDQAATVTRMELNNKTEELEPVTYKTTYFHNGDPVVQAYGKMGKSLKNAEAPDDMCEQYGCDTLRLYEMYLGPLEQNKPWNTRDVVGVHRFLQRLWRNFVHAETGESLVSDEAPTDELRRKLHRTIQRVSDAMESMSFNVAIAALIELNNDLVQLAQVPREVAEPLVLCLAPMAPHIAEELWRRLGHEQSLAHQPWPLFDSSLLVESQIEMPVQVNGKVRSRVTVPADADDNVIETIARADQHVAQAIGDATIRKVIIIPGRMINIVAK